MQSNIPNKPTVNRFSIYNTCTCNRSYPSPRISACVGKLNIRRLAIQAEEELPSQKTAVLGTSTTRVVEKTNNDIEKKLLS